MNAKVLLSVFLFPLPAFSAASVDVVVSRLEHFYRETKTMEARFEQTYRSSRFGNKEVNGNVSIAKPGKMRWDYDVPKGRVFVSNGKKLTLYDPEERQALMTLQPKEEELPVGLLFLWGKGNLQKSFVMSIVKEDGQRITLKGVPREPIPNVSEVELRLRMEPKIQVEASVIRDVLGGETELRFTDVRHGGEIPSKRFEFTPPEGTTLVPVAMDRLKTE